MLLERLNAADHFTLTMDHEIRKSGSVGNFCAIAMELQGIPDPDVLARRCTDFAARFPRATARLQTQGRQFAWRLDGKNPLPFYRQNLTAADHPTVLRQMELIINRPSLPQDAAPVELHLLMHESISWLMMRWFHPACDAKGAELVLFHLFQDETRESNEISPFGKITQDMSWWQKIKLGLRAKRNIDQLDRHSSILPQEAPANHYATDSDRESNADLVLYTEQFDTETSTRILNNARRATGLTGIALYFIGCMMRALERIDEKPMGEAYLVPYAVNFRRNRALTPVFGNQVGFLFLQAERSIVRSRKRLFGHLKAQNRDAVKQRLDLAMLPLMQAASWLSLEKHGKIVRNTSKGQERSSFWFSYTGNMEPDQREILGCPISYLMQMSQITTPPGLSLLINNFQGRLILNLNYVKGQFSQEWMERLFDLLSDELLAEGAAE